jgi:acyl-CoA thioesterase
LILICLGSVSFVVGDQESGSERDHGAGDASDASDASTHADPDTVVGEAEVAIALQNGVQQLALLLARTPSESADDLFSAEEEIETRECPDDATMLADAKRKMDEMQVHLLPVDADGNIVHSEVSLSSDLPVSPSEPEFHGTDSDVRAAFVSLSTYFASKNDEPALFCLNQLKGRLPHTDATKLHQVTLDSMFKRDPSS